MNQCPRCHEAGSMLEEIALFPQTRTCYACNEYQRRCMGCYRWHAEHELTVIDHSAICPDCVEMEADYAREDAERRLEQDAFRTEQARDRWELVRLGKGLTMSWRF